MMRRIAQRRHFVVRLSSSTTLHGRRGTLPSSSSFSSFPLTQSQPEPFHISPASFRCCSSSSSSSVESGRKQDEMASQIIQYAQSLKGDEGAYTEAVRVLEQGLSFFTGNDSSSVVAAGRLQLTLATIHSNRGELTTAAEVLLKLAEISTPLEITVAALEALTGLYLYTHQDDEARESSQKMVDVVNNALGIPDVERLKSLKFRATSLQQLVELICSGTSSMGSDTLPEIHKDPSGAASLAYAEIFHAQGNLSYANELYEKAADFAKKGKKSGNGIYSIMYSSPEEVEIGALAGLGQLLLLKGEYDAAEEKLTTATKLVEKLRGEHDTHVGVVLSCIGDLYHKRENVRGSNDPLITEALYRRSLDLMKVPPLNQEGTETSSPELVDIVALSRGRLADVLMPISNRRDEAFRLRRCAQETWKIARPFEELFPEEVKPALQTNVTNTNSQRNVVIDVRLGRVL